MQRLLPELQIDLLKIHNNSSQIVMRCADKGISVCGVIKGCSGVPEIARVISETGVSQLGTSRIDQAYECKNKGIKTPFLLLRVPGLSELSDVIQVFEYSLESEIGTVKAINHECKDRSILHKVVMMVDLGDLREGYWDKTQFVEDCIFIEKELDHICLSGIGVNLGCYGAIKPTVDKMNDLVALAKEIEIEINHPLEIISGGATTSFPLVHNNSMPIGINHLRIGDNILLSRGLRTNWNINDMEYLDMSAFLIRAEVVEVKIKPSYPQGEFAFNAYGKLPQYDDIGMRRRALVALGNADVGDVKELVPKDKRFTIVGGSSDYMIIDVSECDVDLSVGDIVEFYPQYINMLHFTGNKNAKLTYL